MSEKEKDIVVTEEEMLDEVMKSYLDAAREEGIDETYLARRAKSEFVAKTRKLHKISGKLREGDTLPPGYRVIGVFLDADGQPTTALEQMTPDMPLRQKARESQSKLFGHEPKRDALLKQQFQSITFISMMPEPDPPPDLTNPNACISGTEHLIDIEDE